MKKLLHPCVKTPCILLLILFGFQCKLYAQAPEPPFPVEMLFGHHRLYFQMVAKKKFSPDSRFGFFSVATYSASYKNDTKENSIIMPVQFSYSIGRGFGIMAGTDINAAVGFSPIVGPQHNFASQRVLAVTVVSFFLNEDHDVKIFGLYEYKPPLGEHWSLYSRLQFIYNHNWQEGFHNRSYLYLRGGVKKGPLIFGIGANLDQFGPEKIFEDNYGLFVRWEFK